MTESMYHISNLNQVVSCKLSNSCLGSNQGNSQNRGVMTDDYANLDIEVLQNRLQKKMSN